MAGAVGLGPGIKWRLRDLVTGSLLALLFLFPLTYLILPQLLASRGNLLLYGIGLEALAVIPAVLIIARWRGTRHLGQFGLGRYPLPKALWQGVGGGVALFALTQGFAMLMSWFGVQLPAQKLLEDTLPVMQRPAQLVAFFAMAAVVAPVWEEIFFRGFFYRVLRQQFGIAAGIIVSAIIFALLHGESILLSAPIFLLGIWLAWIFEWTGSLYVPMLAHGVANAISVALAYLGLAR